MRKKFTMLFALLLACVGVMAENVLFNESSNPSPLGDIRKTEFEGQNYEQYHWTSSKLTAPTGFTTLRLTFLGNSNGEMPAGYPIVTLSEFYLYDKNGDAVELTADLFSSNATEGTEGSIETLCDGVVSGDINKYDWYWHSSWSSNVGAFHYLEINVSEVEADLSEFSFGYVTRRTQASPAEFVVTTGTGTEDVSTQFAAYDLFSAYDFANQSFYIKNASISDESLYVTVVAANSGDQNEGGVKVLAKEVGNNAQVFSFIPQDGGTYYIKSQSNTYLNTLGDWGLNAVSEPVTTENRSNFTLNYVGNGKFTISGIKGMIGPNNDYGANSGHPYEMFSNHSGGKVNWTLELYVAPQTQELKAALLEKIQSANTLYEACADKTCAEVVALKTAIDKAQGVYDKADATADEITAESDALVEATALIQNYSPYFPSMLKEITAGKYLIYYTEGETKHYLQTSGANSVVTVTENPQKYEVSAGTTDGGKYTKSYFLKMNNLYISNTSQNATNIETKPGAQLWSSQVVFEKNGKCAIRLTNATATDGWHGNYFIGKGTEAGTTIALAPETSLSDVFIWTFEEVTMSEAEIAAEELGRYLDAFYADYYDAWGTGWRNAPGVNNYSQPEDDQPLNEAYEDVKAFYEAITEETTADAINEKKAYLEGLEANLTINQPSAGKFYRLRCVANKSYLSSVVSAVSESDSEERFEISGSNGVEAMFMYDGESLLSYTEGLYANAHAFAAVGAQKSSVVFTAAANGGIGQYNIKIGDRFIYGQGNTKNNHVDSGAGNPTATTTNGYNWWLEEVASLPVSVSAAGYATLYAPVALTIADGVKAYTAAVEGTTLTLNEVEGTIPAETGVILEAEKGTYNFAVAADVDAIEGNALVGSFAKSEKNADAKVYTLQAPKDKQVGFYLFKGQDAEGKTTYINGFRAWIEVAEGEEAPAMFTLGRGGEEDEDTTGIDQLINNGEVVIYDLSGRRVEKMEKGIYIVNGKKVVK